MKLLKFLSFAMLLSIIAISCSKDDTTPPVITILTPVEGATLIRGTSYPVTGTVTDDEALATIDAAGQKITTFDSPTNHAFKNLNIKIDSTQAPGNYNISISATDKAGNTATKIVNFKVQ